MKARVVYVLKQNISASERVLNDAIKDIGELISVTTTEGQSHIFFTILYKELIVEQRKPSGSKKRKA